MKNSVLKMTMPLIAAICAAATSVLADALPSTLTHRWSFNSNDKDEITGADPADRFGGGNVSVSGGRVHFRGNAWGGGSLSLGVGSLGSGDATVEIWVTQDEIRNNSVIFSYSNNGWGSAPTMDACMQWSEGTDINKDWMWLKSDNVDRVKKGNTMAPYELGKEYHIAMTFHDNGDGSTTVYWQKRDAATGMLGNAGEAGPRRCRELDALRRDSQHGDLRDRRVEAEERRQGCMRELQRGARVERGAFPCAACL